MKRRQKKRLINFLGGVIGVLCLGMVIGTVYAGNLNRSNTEEEVTDSGKLLREDNFPVTQKREEKAEPEEEVLKEELPDDWNLILVNRTHPLPDDFEVELKSIGGGHKIDARAYDDYQDMIKAAKQDGVYIYVTSSYRTMDKQIALHEAKIEEGVMMDYSYAEAKERAAEVVAVPGTSEHQAGLALDFVSSEYRRLDEKQEKTKGFQWLKENCYDYGFILRYPNGKTEVTGIIYEPWHFRYVGKKAALEIQKSGQTLEEYLGAIPISEGTPVEYDSSMVQTKKQPVKPVTPIQEPVLPENEDVPEESGEEETGDDSPSVPSEPQQPSAPVETPVTPTPAEPSPPPQQPTAPVEPQPSQPVTPVQPSQPEVPVEPSQPETPPEVPEPSPEAPAEPTVPQQPTPEAPPAEAAPEQTAPPADTAPEETPGAQPEAA